MVQLNFSKMFLRKFLKPVITFGFFYQFYDLTCDYLKLDHVNQLSVDFTFGLIPSVTICVERKYKICGNDPRYKLINQSLNCIIHSKNLYNLNTLCTLVPNLP